MEKGSAIFSTMPTNWIVVGKFLIKMLGLDENDLSHVKIVETIISQQGGV